MTSVEFVLLRLNFVDRLSLFSRPLRADQDLIRVVTTASRESFDRQRARAGSGFRWSMRATTEYTEPDTNRPTLIFALARSTLYRRGNVVSAEGIRRAVSESTPPLADTVSVILDLKYHVLAVEYSSTLMQSDVWRTELENILTAAAYALEFTTQIRLEPIRDVEEIRGELGKFTKVTRLRLKLRIPNPDIGPSFKRLYDEMIQGDVRELREDMSNPDGLNLSGDGLPRASLDMALGGYRKGPIVVNGATEAGADRLTIGEDISRIEVQGIRDVAQAILDASDESDVRRAVRAVLKKIDQVLKHHDEEGGFSQ